MTHTISTYLNSFLKMESASGIILIFAALFAIIANNSALAGLYDQLLHTTVAFQVGALKIEEGLLHWINDGLMAIFFLLIGLEVKREVMVGELSSWKKSSLPIIAAVGGMVVPAILYAAINYDTMPSTLDGWAIPAATDIAFALGILSLLGKRAPASLKIFLLALAIIDDLGAIIIIAFFYTSDLSLTSLYLAAGCVGILCLLNYLKVSRIAAYILVGAIMWICVLKSGVHATLAGVVTALFIPRVTSKFHKEPITDHLEETLHPWVAFGIMPLFAFANAGISFAGMSFQSVLEPVPLGIIAGLFIGKQVGVFLSSWSAIKLGFCQKPEDTSWMQLYGASLLTGIGFTMSLFIGTLAFEENAADPTAIRLGVIIGSVCSGLFGYLVLRFAPQRKTA